MDIRNVTFISAGAGSGKTYALTEKLFEKISGNECHPSEIVLTTFTRAAANEFKERARARLIEKGCLEQADLLTEATIGTVHSVCLSFLRKYWYRNGSVVIPKEISDTEKDSYISGSLSGVVDEDDIRLFNEFREEFDIKDGKNMPNFSWWKGYLEDFIKKTETFNVKDLQKSKDESFCLIDSVFNRDDEGLGDSDKSVLQSYLDFCKGSAAKNAKEHIDFLERILGSRGGLKYWQLVKLSGVVSEPGDKRNLKKDPLLQSGLEAVSEKMPKILLSKRYGEIVKKVVARILELAEKWKDIYAEYKRENGLIDYNDMELQFLNLLNDENVVEEIRDNVKLVMVDEFQDCNQTQIRIFEKLSAIAKESIWVGDPKQAIYKFRGSDTELTNAIADIFADTESMEAIDANLKFENLGISYRSVPEIVNFVNELFSDTFRQYGMDRSRIVLEPNRKESGSVKCWKVEGKNKTDKARKVVFRIAELIKGGKNPGDIAILVRSNDEVSDYVGLLKEVGIPVNSSQGDITEYAEVQMLLSVLKYVLNSRNELAKAEILRLFSSRSSAEIISDRIGYLQSVNESKSQETSGYVKRWMADDELFRKIDSISEQVKTQSVSDAVKGIVTSLSLYRECEKWGDRLSRKSRLDAIVSMAVQYENDMVDSGRAASLNGFLSAIMGGRLSNPDTSEISTRSEGITVCTYHKSKGLQWETVILDSLCKDYYKDSEIIKNSIFGVNAHHSELPSKNNPYTDNYLTFFPRFLSTSQTSVPDGMIQSLEDRIGLLRESLKKENNRLFYVGMTRAKDNLVLLLSGTNRSGSFNGDFYALDAIVPDNCKHLNERLQDAVENLEAGEFESVDMKYMKMHKPVASEEIAEDKYIVPSQYSPDCISAKAELLWHTDKVPSNKLLINIDDVDSEGTMAEAGTCIHNVFAAYRQNAERNVNVEMAKRIVSSCGMDVHFRNPEEIISSAEEAYAFLERHYGRGIALKEVPFSMGSGMQVFTGEMDLVWDLGDGRCVLVDFKSYPGFDLNGHALKYAGQLMVYSEALEKAGYTLVDQPLIYFNAHGAFVKVEMV